MGSVFKSLSSGARQAHNAHFSESVTLVEVGQAARPIAATVFQERVETIVVQGREERITLRKARLIDITNVRHDGQVIYEGVTYSIHTVLDRPASGLIVDLKRVQSHSIERRDYRGK